MIKDKIKIANIELNGRIIMPAIATAKSTSDGKVTQDLIDYYESRAKNDNVAMIITEHAYISKEGQASPNMMSISDDSDIEGIRKIADIIHKYGKKAIFQINHAGSEAFYDIVKDEIVSPSGISVPGCKNDKGFIKSKALSEEDIKVLIDKYAKASLRAKNAGYDGVEIHSTHGYLLNEFYSPITNKRKDQYGGSIEKRINIHRQVIRAVRKAVGEDYLISLRLGANDYVKGGSTIEDAVYACKVFEKEGVNLIDISGGLCGIKNPNDSNPGYFKDASKAVKDVVSIPVILTGGVSTLEQAEDLLQDEQADLIGIGRSLWKDPNWEL
ncbi:NADH:flavin oxidoreductase [Peptostreptococcus equinus]|uniref:NADH:flavin oxidoreductase n=1 Tax=Peptostreptococcus equinus TaxID=3003601 RepID=A0ABY7JTA4_9FIRM|nr:NADH:flavin oxidoreductase [Peptostreptococcus sp. CBA3647]WAW15398.1 NADH:flavin oxidoreductase [Peptostreptococcus sp. CBA3647]